MNISEKELEDYLVEHLDKIAPLDTELKYIDRQYKLDGSIIDILATIDDEPCIVELKTHELNDAAVGQIIRYAGLVARAAHYGPSIRPHMILVGSSCPPSILPGCVALGITVWTYTLALDGVIFNNVSNIEWHAMFKRYKERREKETADE